MFKSAMSARGAWEWWSRKALTNPDGPYVQVFRNAFWVCNDSGQFAIWRGPEGALHPQCNADRVLAERQVERVPGATGYRALALAFVPIRIEDYR